MPDTPIESSYPWVALGDEGPKLPENPTPQDFAKAYATMLLVYQAQRSDLAEVMKAYRDERREVLAVLRDIRRQQNGPTPMPTWAKVHAFAIVALFASTLWLLFAVQRLAHFH